MKINLIDLDGKKEKIFRSLGWFALIIIHKLVHYAKLLFLCCQFMSLGISENVLSINQMYH